MKIMTRAPPLGSGDTQAYEKHVIGIPYKDDNPQKTSRDGVEKERVKSKHGGGVQYTRTGGTTPIETGRDQACGRGWKGGGGGVAQ